MTLRLHVQKKDTYFQPTDLFQISGTIDYSRFENLLARIKYWVSDPRHYFAVLDKNGVVAFRVTDNGVKYEFEHLESTDDKIEKERIEQSVSKITGLPLSSILVKRRNHEVYKPRIVLFSALRFFSKMPTKGIERTYSWDHSTVINSCKAISSFYSSNDDFVQDCVNKLSMEFNNTYYLESVVKNKYPRE